jgi:putative oxidoreductase
MWQESYWRLWFKNNREIAIEGLRIYLGVALLIKGIQFMVNEELAQEYMAKITIPFFEFISIHIVALIHIAGGFLLAIGLITRIAALIQIPNLLGAVFFVHLQQGLFTRVQNLEFVILVLFLLFVFVVYGGGQISLDHIFDKRSVWPIKKN